MAEPTVHRQTKEETASPGGGEQDVKVVEEPVTEAGVTQTTVQENGLVEGAQDNQVCKEEDIHTTHNSGANGGANADVLTDGKSDAKAAEVHAPNDSDNTKDVSKTTSHVRNLSKVEVIEAPNRTSTSAVRSSIDTASYSAPSSSQSSAPLHPDPAQHRHDSRSDQPSSYQPSTPRIYLQLRAMALQLPNNTNNAPNASHIDPPTIIMEGRTNLSSARRSFYPKVTRTLPELHLWLLALTLSFPASIFSPFTYPLASLTNGGSPSEAAIRSYLVNITNQLGRILIKPYVLSHPATVALVDCDFSYTPLLPHIGPGSSPLARRKMDEGISLARAGFDPFKGRKGKGGSNLTTNSVTSTWDVDGVAAALGLPTAVYAANHDAPAPSSSSVSSKNPLSLFSAFNSSPQRIQQAPVVALPPGEEDEDEEDLTLARNEITRLEMQFEKASRAAESVVEKGGSLNATLNQLTQALGNLERLDSGRIIAKRAHENEIVDAMVKGIEGWAAAEAGASSTSLSTITPLLAYQSLNARMAIDALLRRVSAATHRHSALVVLVQKRREAERLKRARGEIRQEEVDWVLNELKEAQRTTQILTNHLATFTATLKEELKNHSRFTHSDVQASLVNHARNSIRAHKFMLHSLCKARDDLMARREGKRVEGQVTRSVSSTSALSGGPMPLASVVQEEIPPYAYEAAITDKDRKASEAVNNSQATAPFQSDLSRPNDADAEEPSSAPSASREKALPTAPTDEGLSSEQAEHEKGKDEQQPNKEASIAEEGGQARLPAQGQRTEDEAANTTIPTSSHDSNWSDNAPLGITQSGFLPPPASSLNPTADVPAMAQSAFLPGRNMERYANPFARLDPSLSNPAFPSNGISSPPVPNSSSRNTTTTTNKPESGKVKANDVWANRSRLSASDAARSLAGRF